MSWFRYHTDALDNPKIQSLPAVLFKFWVNLLCVSKKVDGFLPETSEISFRCRCSEPQAKEWISELKRRRLIDEPNPNEYYMHDWNEHQFVSDDVTARVRKHRAKRKGNVSVTPSEQSRAENRAEQSAGAPVPPWGADEIFVRFVSDFTATGAAVIHEDFIPAYKFVWLKLDWEQKGERVKALAERTASYRECPQFVPKPEKFLQQEWKRPIRTNGKPTPLPYVPAPFDARKAKEEELESARQLEIEGYNPDRIRIPQRMAK